MKIFKSVEELVNIFEAACNGDPEAMLAIHAFFSMTATEEQSDWIKELKESFVDQLAILGDPKGCILKGDECLSDEYEEPDPKAAIQWYLKAVIGGEWIGIECIGAMFFDGKVVEKNYSLAKKLFLFPSEYGQKLNRISLRRLGQMYKYGLGVEKDLDLAVYYFCKTISVEIEYFNLDDDAIISRQELVDII